MICSSKRSSGPWCDRNNLQWTGHWWEHLWPYPWSTPSDMSYYAFQHTPGIDMLIFSAFDLFEKGVSPHMLFTIKQVASAARQLGRPRVLSETYGGGGWRATLEDFKRMGDWEIVHGINLVNQHLAHVTVRGARKRDWPQSFSDAAAWWPYYRGHADHTARLSLAMSAGAPTADVLVLNPTTSAFLLARRSEPQDGNPDLESLKGDVEGLVQFLADHQVSFDLGDEYLLEWLGETRGGELKVGQAAYRWVVLPSSTMNLRAPAAKLLEQHHASGGGILLLGDPPRFVDGRPAKDIGAGWARVASRASLLEELNRREQASRIAFDHPLPPGVGFAERALRDGNRLLLFNNAGPATVEAVATVPGGAVEEWNTLTGEIRPYPADTREGGSVRFRWKLAPAGSLLLSVSDSGAPPPARPVTESVTELRADGWKITPESPNVLVLDFCDVNVNGREIRNALAMQAAKEIYRAHGFDANPWDGATQFRQVIFDRNRFGPDSGFTAAFRFEVADAAALEGLELAVETPEFYQVRVNGTTVSFETAPAWLDPRIRRTSIAGQSRTGGNVIEITGRPFDVRMELEAIYLLGRFGLHPSPRGFELAAAAALRFGPWSDQGRPFDGGLTRYDATTQVTAKGTLRVSLGRWAGSAAEVLIDGARAGVLGWAPWYVEAPVTAGRHEVTVRVAGTPRNVFGPFHDPRPEPRVLWPGHWNLFANIGPPRGEQYDVAPYGLLEPPRLELRR